MATLRAMHILLRGPIFTGMYSFDKPDIVAITETWLSDEIGDAELVSKIYYTYSMILYYKSRGVLPH